MTARSILAVTLGALLVSCGSSHGVDDLDAGTEPPPCVPDTDDLDLLLAIENAGNVTEEIASLTLELPRLVRVLSTGDRDGDGTAEFDPVRSLHVAVVTSDMGVGGADVPTCGGGLFGHDFGDDGILMSSGPTWIPDCTPTYPSVLEFAAGGGEDVEAFASDLACLTWGVGSDGCGFEQQLEAVLKALSPSAPTSWTADGYEPPLFFRDTRGHGDRENAGFVREGSVLAVLLLSTEEDCSAADERIFDPAAEPYRSVDLNLRCFTFPEAVHPIERYVRGASGRAGLLGLRRSPTDFVFGVLAGIPTITIEDPAHPDYDAILDHPDMQEEIDPSMTTRLRPSCNVPGRGVAFPPRRIVRLARALEDGGAGVSVGSLCQDSFAGPIDGFVAQLATALTRPECR